MDVLKIPAMVLLDDGFTPINNEAPTLVSSFLKICLAYNPKKD
jgi:hypothetical protein